MSPDANHRRQKPLMRCTAVFIAQLGTPGHADWLMVVYRSFVLSRAPSNSVTVSYSTSQEQIRDPVTQPNRTSRSYVLCVIGAEIICVLYSWLGLGTGWTKRDSIPYWGRNVLSHNYYQHTQRTQTAIIFGNKITGKWGRPFIWIQNRWSFTSITAIHLHNVAIKHWKTFTSLKVRKELGTKRIVARKTEYTNA
jgi:hypothetical protein